jgi:hypothetical protein
VLETPRDLAVWTVSGLEVEMMIPHADFDNDSISEIDDSSILTMILSRLTPSNPSSWEEEIIIFSAPLSKKEIRSSEDDSAWT